MVRINDMSLLLMTTLNDLINDLSDNDIGLIINDFYFLFYFQFFVLDNNII